MKKGKLIALSTEIAIEAHEGHVDKAGAPYISHPLRVAAKMKSVASKAAAILHDVVEDSNFTFADLSARGIPEDVVIAIEHLTHRPGEPYGDYIIRAGENPISREAQIGDLEDNMDITRLPEIGSADIDRLNKYLRAYTYLVELL